MTVQANKYPTAGDQLFSSNAAPTKCAGRALSREADKFVVRLPDDLRPRVKAEADESDRSMNAVIIQALRQYLDGQRQQRILLNALNIALAQEQRPSPTDICLMSGVARIACTCTKCTQEGICNA